MRGEAESAWVEAALDGHAALQWTGRPDLQGITATTAMTDVTGFGLAGHLLELLRMHQARWCAPDRGGRPCQPMPERVELLARGVASTLHPGNVAMQAKA